MNKYILLTLILIIGGTIGMSASDPSGGAPKYKENRDSPLDSNTHVPIVTDAPDYNYAVVSDNNPAPNLISGLISYWNFDNDLEDGIRTNDGSFRGIGSTYQSGVFEEGIRLNGNGYIEVPHDTTLNFTGKSLTISAWFQVDSFNTNFQTLISKGENRNFRIARRSETDSVAYNGGNTAGLIAGVDISTGLHHVVGVTDAGKDSIYIYIDGMLRSERPNSLTILDSGKSLLIGENPEATARKWNGMIDDVAIWDKPLSASDVAYIYNAGNMDKMSIGDILCATGDILYVDANNDTSGDGSCWASALKDLQVAINISNSCGGGKQIWVAKGTYRPTQARDIDDNDILETREKTFYITEPVQIYGGFTPGATMFNERDALTGGTILTGVLTDMGTDTAYHVITMEAGIIDTDWVLDGLVIRDGRATGTGRNRDGGGIFADAFAAFAIGAGVPTCSPSIINSTFYNNSANNRGGAINATIHAVFFGDGDPAATSSPSIINSTFHNNNARNGAGIYSTASASVIGFGDPAATISPSIINSTFYNNSAADDGGGIYAAAESQSFSSVQSFATSSPSIINSTFTNNSATTGGGMYARADADATIVSPMISNALFWRNTVTGENSAGPDIWKSDSDAGLTNGTIGHSILSSDMSVQGLITTYTDTLIQDPLFLNTFMGSEDLRLMTGSPAIDTGLNQAITSSTDHEGKTRLIGDRVDMGAYEYGMEDDCDQNVFLHPQELISVTRSYQSEQLIFATNKITSTNITYDALLGVELGLEFEVAIGAIFQAELDGCE